MFRQLLTIPNLLSLSRVALTPVVAYALSRNDNTGIYLCVAVFVVAAVTDGLDGYLARRLNQVTPVGIALDPIADKVFAGAIGLFLLIYREFPLWLAAIIIGRDLIILAAGSILLRGRTVSLPSNLTGKYAFAAIAVLLGSYIIRFPFGIELLTWITLPLIALSLLNYARVFACIRYGKKPPMFADKAVYKWTRGLVTWSLSAWYLYRLYTDLIS
jgi:CDP-diacylglycerol--glycerol-3-phosphate 3-phosphatidyltransferase